MEEHWMWYLSGAIDTAGTISVGIKKGKGGEVAYQFRPNVMFSRSKEYSVVLGMVDEYCEDYGVQYRVDEMNEGDTTRFITDTPEGVKRFLEPISDGFIQQRESVELMLGEILPMMEEDKHRTKEGVIQLMEPVERLRELSPTRRKTKYTQEYFEEKWNMD